MMENGPTKREVVKGNCFASEIGTIRITFGEEYLIKLSTVMKRLDSNISSVADMAFQIGIDQIMKDTCPPKHEESGC